jgi:RNA polymerase sigma-70 factor (ECF subfamily)
MFAFETPSALPPAVHAVVSAALAREGPLTSGRGGPVVTAPDDRAARDRELAEWLRAAAAGDHAAFERFYDATLGYAHAVARRMLRPADLEDLLADAYFQAWREAPRFDAGRGSPVTWLLTLVRSRCLDLLRHQRASPEVASDDGGHDERPSHEPGPDQLLDAIESGTRLHAALAALSAHERWVLGLAYWRELTHREICEVTALPLGTVKSLILRAQAKLREQLKYS